MRFFLAALLWAACAKVGPPSGGPVDREAPAIAQHRPSADAVEVPLDAVVELVFSEEMDRERTEGAVFMAPEGKVRYRWSGRRLRLETQLQERRTYVVTVGTAARDVRGNALEQSFTFAFATGSQISQGRMEGCVYRLHRPASGAHVWAHDLAGTDPQRPAYRTQTGADGRYQFQRLAPGRYRLMAFLDENRNREPDPGEWLALPSGDVELAQEQAARAGDLALVVHGPQAPRLLRVQAVHHKRLLFSFAGPVNRLQVELEGLEVEKVHPAAEDRRKHYAITAPQERGRAYRLRRLEADGHVLSWKEPVRGSGQPDRTPPRLIGRASGKIAPTDSLVLLFSEAMHEAELEDFWMASDSTQAPAGIWRWSEPTRAVFIPEEPLAAGPCLLKGGAERLRDLEGLALADSVVRLDLEVVGSLAQVRGRVQATEAEPGRARVEALNVQEERNYTAWTDSSGAFALEEILPGRYVVAAFVDRDGDGAQGTGQWQPFSPAEPYGRLVEELELAPGQVVEELGLECR